MSLTAGLQPLSKRSERVELLHLLEKKYKRELETNFSKFIQYVFSEYYASDWINNSHHDEIIDLITRIEAREVPNAVINMPPRYGKTELAVILWVCWVLVRNPRAQFIHVSYSVDLALKNSAQIRDILRSACIQKYWPIKMRDSADSKGLWLTEQGGGFKADSTAGQVTGFGAGITSWKDGEPFDGAILIDDPNKPEDAKSETMRNTVNGLLSGTLHSRKNHPKVPMLIVMQRLHEEDASGYAMAGRVMGDKFEHLKIAALVDGKALWPRKHTIEMLEAMKLSDRLVFASQYQQTPVPQEGAVYKLPWFPRYVTPPQPPTRTMIVHSWDTAYKAGEHNDPSACTIWHITPSVYYIADVQKGRWEYHELRKRVFDLANEQKPDAILIEDKASGQSLIQELQAGTSHPVIAIKPEGDKETRARTTAAMVESRKVALPEQAPWLADYEHEMMSFPNGKHDDMVDSTSQFLRWIKERGGDSNTEFMAMMDRLYS